MVISERLKPCGTDECTICHQWKEPWEQQCWSCRSSHRQPCPECAEKDAVVIELRQAKSDYDLAMKQVANLEASIQVLQKDMEFAAMELLLREVITSSRAAEMMGCRVVDVREKCRQALAATEPKEEKS